MDDLYYIYRPLLDLIGRTEGTDKGRGYNETLDYGAYTGGDVDLVSMTLAQVDALQTEMLRHPKNSMNSSALGRYQIVRKTRRMIQKVLGLPGSALYDALMQDRMACFLLGQRGIDNWLAGKMSDAAILNALAHEWASLPTASGKGAYGGQNAAVKPKTVLTILADVRARWVESRKSPQKAASAQEAPPATHEPSKPVNGAPAPLPESGGNAPVIVEKPVLADPGEMETPPAKSKTVWTWALAGLGAIVTAIGNVLGGLDWRVQMFISVMIVAFAVYGIKRRADLFKAVKALKAELE